MGRPAGEPPEADPYHLGTISPTPDPEATFEFGETVVFSYQVYNARHRDKRGDAGGDKMGDGRPALEVEYRFFLDRGERLEVVGKPVVLNRVTGESLAYALPLTGWPEAKYRLQVQVTDTLARSSARGEARFRVIEPGPSQTSEKDPL